MNLEQLRYELRVVADNARHGVHQKVADRCNINREYLRQIRKGKNLFVDSEENRKLILQIIDAYRVFDQEYRRELEEYKKQHFGS